MQALTAWNGALAKAVLDIGPVVSNQGTVNLKLAMVGRIEEIRFLPNTVSGGVAGVAWFIELLYEIARDTGIQLSPTAIVDDLNRMFPLVQLYRGKAEDATDFEEREKRTGFENQIRVLLTEYKENAVNLEQVAQKVSDVLGLEEPMEKSFTTLTRLTYAHGIALRREERGAKGGEPICKIRCPACRRVALFRLDLRDTGSVRNLVYRIPGLTYSDSVRDGVGLVIDEKGRITGRMRFGPPACYCSLMETVEIRWR